MRKIDLIFIDSGGGHRAAATALSEVIRGQQRPWDLRLLNIQDLLDSIDIIRKSTGIQFQELYNIMLRRNWTLGAAQLVPVMHLLIRLLHKEQVRLLEQRWKWNRPDMVVSLIPHYNRAFKQALERTWPGTPLVTILTDIADYPPHFWIERQDQYVVCGSKRAADQALALGLPRARLLQVSGMILNPGFYAPANLDRGAERIRLGLQPDLPTGLVLFGGQGSMDMVKIARALNSVPGLQLILLCGRNQTVEKRLRALPRRIPMFVQGFTNDIPYYMALADFFIGKAGPGSISEALAMRLPVIVERNAWTLPQERYNADWIQEQQVGVVLRSFSEIAGAVGEFLRPEALRRYRDKAAGIRNFAVYEIPGLLDKILSDSTEERAWREPPASSKHSHIELFH